MNTKQAVEFLRRYQQWRRGKIIVWGGEDRGTDPREVTQAIDVVCDALAAQLQAAQQQADADTGFSTPDCPDCGCVQDGQCLCIPSKPPAGAAAEGWIQHDGQRPPAVVPGTMIDFKRRNGEIEWKVLACPTGGDWLHDAPHPFNDLEIVAWRVSLPGGGQ